jgi:methyl acetate hydrolase
MRTMFTIVATALIVGCAPQEVRLSGEGDAFLDQALSDALADTDLPGVVALVTTGDSVIYRRAYGVMGIDRPDPLVEDAIFAIHSMTKPLTSLALMMLVERGDVDLDAPVSRYLEDFSGREVLVAVDTVEDRAITRPASREVTIRDLLRHTSGLAYTFSNHELLQLARNGGTGGRAQPLVHDPGERWTYGMGTAVVGWVVEEVTGQTLSDFLRAEVFVPLGMNETSFDLGPSMMDRLVDEARRTDGELVPSARPDSIVGGGRGDGGLLSTADDYAHFMQLVLGEGARGSARLLSTETLAEMTRDQLDGFTVTEQPGAIPTLSHPFPLGAGHDGFSLGFQVSTTEAEDRRAPGSLSWSGLANTHFWIDRDTGVGVVLLFRVLPFYDPAVIAVMDRFERALYGVALNRG